MATATETEDSSTTAEDSGSGPTVAEESGLGTVAEDSGAGSSADESAGASSDESAASASDERTVSPPSATFVLDEESSEHAQKTSAQTDRPKNSRLSYKSLDDSGFARLPNYLDALERYLKELEILK